MSCANKTWNSPPNLTAPLAPRRGNAWRLVQVVSSVLEILENWRVGINAALKGDVRDGYRGSQSNKQKINKDKRKQTVC